MELGVTFFTNRVGLGGTRRRRSSSPRRSSTTTTALVFSDFLNLSSSQERRHRRRHPGAEQKGFFQSLAEPNLIAYNGQEASFLAGGEFPVPVVSGAAGTVTVHVQGVRHPPELQADHRRRRHPAAGQARGELARFQQRRQLSGFRIPALTTRRAETDVELRDGQSFAIAGLLNNISQEDGSDDSDSERAADHRQPVQEQGGSRGADRADGADHATAGAAARS